MVNRVEKGPSPPRRVSHMLRDWPSSALCGDVHLPVGLALDVPRMEGRPRGPMRRLYFTPGLTGRIAGEVLRLVPVKDDDPNTLGANYAHAFENGQIDGDNSALRPDQRGKRS